MTGPRVESPTELDPGPLPAAPSRRVNGFRTGRNGKPMKCIVCRKTIPAERRKITNNKTCSVACSGTLTRQGMLNRAKSYRARQRQKRDKIEHLPLVCGTDLTVRKGHVVALQEPGQTDWCLVLVVCSSQKNRRATHACPASLWSEKPTARNRLPGEARIAVLPPEWAQEPGLAVAAEEAGMEFCDLEDLRQALAPGTKRADTEKADTP